MSQAKALLREHWLLVAVLCAGLLARLIVAIAYRPALFFSDSWAYLTLAYSGERLAPDRPSGYPLLLELIGLPGRSLTAVVALQHLAGLAVGLLAYALLVRAGVKRGLAAAAAALVVLNSYAVVLEQTILAESFFTLATFASFFLVMPERRSTSNLALAGLLLAAAVTMRSAAMFAVPIWLLYVFYRHRMRGAIAMAAVALPLLAYAALHQSETGEFGLTTADGWFLYGRVGEIADCSIVRPPPDTRDLCEPAGADGGLGPLYYIWSRDSAANRRFPRRFDAPGSSELLRRFAVSVIEARPGEYATLVGRDTVRYFVPGAGSPGRSDAAINLPSRPRRGQPWLNTAVRDEYLPGVEPEVHAPARVARAYATVFRIPRPLLGLMVALPLLLVPLAIMRQFERPRHLPEALAMALSAVAMLVGPAATSGFIVRYLVPVVPLIVCGGALALHDLLARRRVLAAPAAEPVPDPAAHSPQV